MDYREQIKQLRALADAMVIGALLRPQAYFDLFNGYGTCALGAVWEGMGGRWDQDLSESAYIQLERWFPVLLLEAPNSMSQVGEAIVDMNDSQHHTREEIAEWLRGIARSLDDDAPTTQCSVPAADPCTTETPVLSCR